MLMNTLVTLHRGENRLSLALSSVWIEIKVQIVDRFIQEAYQIRDCPIVLFR